MTSNVDDCLKSRIRKFFLESAFSFPRVVEVVKRRYMQVKRYNLTSFGDVLWFVRYLLDALVTGKRKRKGGIKFKLSKDENVISIDNDCILLH